MGMLMPKFKALIKKVDGDRQYYFCDDCWNEFDEEQKQIYDALIPCEHSDRARKIEDDWE